MRIKQLDALRAVAIFLVIGKHLGLPAISWGWVGVDLFFVISGFLVSGLLFRDFKKTGQIHVGNFIARRGFKIYPAYFLFLFLGVASDPLGAGFSANQIWHDVLFVQNYAGAPYPHLWSIAIEEHFYLALPCLLWFLAKRKSREPFSWLPIICGAIGVTCLSLRIAAVFSHSASIVPSATHLRVDSLTFGVLLSYLCEFRPHVIAKVVKARWLYPVSILLLVPACALPLSSFFVRTFGYSCLYLGFGGVLIFVLNCTTGQSWLTVGLSKVGLYSYTIYLVHVSVLHWVGSHRMAAVGSYRDLVLIVACLGLSICVGALFAKAVEIPFLNVRERLFPRPDRLQFCECAHLAGFIRRAA